MQENCFFLKKPFQETLKDKKQLKDSNPLVICWQAIQAYCMPVSSSMPNKIRFKNTSVKLFTLFNKKAKLCALKFIKINL